jgi:multidrug efflux pump
MFARFFIDRPIFAVVVSVFITLAGTVALFSLPVAQYPQITPPSVSISISYPGASAQVVADNVAAPIEQSVVGVPGMLYMSSNSGSDGSYSLSVTFDVGTNLNTALVMVQNRVTLAMPLLPSSVQNQGITVRKKTPDMLMIISLYTTDPRFTNIDLSNFALINLRDELLRVDGVSDVNIMGEKDFSIRVWLDPQKLAARNLTAIDVANAIRSQSIQAAPGQVGQPPAPRKQTRQLPIHTLGRLQTPEEFGNIIIKVGQAAPAHDTSRPAGGTSLSPTVRGFPSSTFARPAGATATKSIIASPASGSSNGSSGSGSSGSGSSGSGSTGNGSSGSGSSSTGSSGGGSGGGSGSGLYGGGASTGGGANAGGGASTSAGTVRITVPSITPSPTNALTAVGAAQGTPTGTPMTSDVLSSSAMTGSGAQGPSTGIVRLRDVTDGPIELGAMNYNQYSSFDSHDAVGVTIYQLPGTNALEVADRVRARIKELAATFPDWVKYNIGYDTTPYIRESIADVVNTLFLAVVLVGIVVLLFLQDWRAMILPMIDVPVSLIGTFAVMALLGYSLNNISLFGLVLAIGIVVDDAIVVLENIERQMAKGLDARTATIKAMEEITGPILAITLVLCAVFVPCAFISGVTGRFFRQFAVTISAAMIISAVNALTLTPSRALAIFKGQSVGGPEGTTHHSPPTTHHKPEALPWWIFGILGGLLTVWLAPLLSDFGLRISDFGLPSGSWVITGLHFLPGLLPGLLVGRAVIRPVNALLGSLFRGFNRLFDQMTAGYDRAIRLALRWSPAVVALYGGLLVLTVWAFVNSRTGFVPDQDQGRLICSLQLPDATALEHTKRIMDDMEKIARDIDGVAHTITNSGSSFMAGANAPNYGSMFVILKPFGERPSAQQIKTRLQNAFDRKIEDARITVAGAAPIPGLSVSGGFKLMVEDLAGLTPEDLQDKTEALIGELKNEPALDKKLSTTLRSKNPQLFLEVDRDKVEAVGVPLSDVNQTLQIYLGSSYVNSFNDFGRHWQVTLQASGRFRSRIEDINRLQVRNNRGQMLPLGALVKVQGRDGPLAVQRYNTRPAAAVMGSLKPGYSSGEVIARTDEVAHQKLPLGMGTEWTELMFLQIKDGDTTLSVFGLAVLCVFLALAALYESWTMPLAVILVVPLCVLCSLLGVWVTGGSLDIFVQIGLVVLVGLACKNAILVVEFAQQLHRDGKPRLEAALEASRLRLRPILMTSFAFIIGVVPLIVATGAGSEMRRSLGTAVFSGMIGVTLFGIFLTPVFFYVIQGFSDRPAFAAVRWRGVASSVAGAAVGLVAGFLLARIGVGGLPWGPIVGACAGALAVPLAIGIHEALQGGTTKDTKNTKTG